METYPGMDGIKTGFINSSGFNLVASAKRNGRRLIGVVFGGPSAVRRDNHMREILDDGFAQLYGAPPGFIVAEFEKPPEAKGRTRFTDQYEPDPPQVTFGTAKRFKATRFAPDPQPLGNGARASRVAKPPLRTEPVRVYAAPSARSSTPPATRPSATTRGAPKAPVHVVSPKPAATKKSSPPPVAKVSSPPPKSLKSSPVCKGGRDKSGKCLAR
jgi:D-alanyl-D-alanine carboxypeptidase